MCGVLMCDIVLSEHLRYCDLVRIAGHQIEAIILNTDAARWLHPQSRHRYSQRRHVTNGRKWVTAEKEVFSFFSTDRRTVEWAGRASRVYLRVSHWPASVVSTELNSIFGICVSIKILFLSSQYFRALSPETHSIQLRCRVSFLKSDWRSTDSFKMTVLKRQTVRSGSTEADSTMVLVGRQTPRVQEQN